MATKYDLFESLYRKHGDIRPIEALRALDKEKREYHNIHKLLRELVKEKIATKANRKFIIKKNTRTNLLYKLISYCIKNDINYNLILEKNLAIFIKRGLEKREINLASSKLNPRTFSKYINILEKYGLGIIISKKPLRFKCFYNTLINNLLIYFRIDKIKIKESTRSHIPDILKELKKFKYLKKKNERKYNKIVEEFEISFINHSLSLEGNPITLPDTIKIIKHRKISSMLELEDVQEIQNYQNAVIQMIEDGKLKKLLNIDTILNYHRLSMFHKKKIAGKIRQIPVHIRGNPNFKVSPVKHIKQDLDALMYQYNKFIKNKKTPLKETIKFAAFFHNEFQHIHPFIDGNSRVTRLITFHLLQYKDIPILDLPLGLLDEYLKKTKSSRTRNDKELMLALEKVILFNLKKINKKLEE